MLRNTWKSWGFCVLAGCSAVGTGETSLGGPTTGASLDPATAPADGSVPSAPSAPVDPDAPLDADCAQDARWIYLVHSDQLGSNHQLLRFEPDKLSLTPVGTLQCAGPGIPNDPFGGLLAGTPFSMAVDRSATAWVLYNDGRLYHVSTEDASCSPTSFAAQGNFNTFGMGFVTDQPGGSEESLYVASAVGSAMLGRLDTNTLSIQSVGVVGGSPELTGTGNAQLWGFFPNTSPASVRRIDKATGGTLQDFGLGFSTTPMAWAFAFWGGRFYVFIEGQTDTSTQVWRLDPTTGASQQVLASTGYHIVGAGVSTCAPVDII